MNILMIIFCFSIPAYTPTGIGCTIENGYETTVGNNPAVTGVCSTNGLRITCLFREGFGTTCDGPAGAYSGYELDSLVFSACGCSAQEESEQRQKEELQAFPDAGCSGFFDERALQCRIRRDYVPEFTDKDQNAQSNQKKM